LSTARRRDQLLVVKVGVVRTSCVTVVDNATSTGAIILIAVISAVRIVFVNPACTSRVLEAANESGVMAASLERPTPCGYTLDVPSLRRHNRAKDVAVKGHPGSCGPHVDKKSVRSKLPIHLHR